VAAVSAAVKRGGALGQQGTTRNPRAVLLDPGKSLERMAAAEYALRHGVEVVCVAGELVDAIHEIANGRADMILALRTKDLRPLIRIVTDPDGPVPNARRRPVRRQR
jgi:hypothetical protein